MLKMCGSNPTNILLGFKCHAPFRATFRSALIAVSAAVIVGGLSEPVVAASSEDFAVQWEALQQAAKKEGQLVILFGGSAGRMYGPPIKHFSEKFGIKVIAPPGSGNQLTNRLLAERQAGRYTADIIHMGANTVGDRLLPAGVLDDLRPELIHPEVTNTSLWFKNRHWWLDAEQKHYFFHAVRLQPSPVDTRINTRLVPKAEQDKITSAFDYLNPKWRGKIVSITPTEEGAGQSWAAQYFHPNLGKEWVTRMITEMNINFVTDFRQVSDGLASGRYAIAFNVGAAGRDIDELSEKGLPVMQMLKSIKEPGLLTTAGTGLIGVATNRPHPNAARLFVNWWLSKEGQTVRQTMSDQTTDQSLRTDGIPDGMTQKEERRVDGVDYFFPMADPNIFSNYPQARDYAAELYLSRRK